jgi:predicted nucleic acid-binding protein
MKLVVDTSVIIAVIANEAEKSRLIALTRDTELLAPASLPWEIGNAFSAMLRRNRITLEQSLKAIAAYRQISLRLIPVDLSHALRVAEELNIYAYDAYMVAVAQRHNCALISLDQHLRRSAASLGIEVLEV